MAKLTPKRARFHPPFDDNCTQKTGQNSPNVRSNHAKKEKRIFQRAISSAKKHGINLLPGRVNEGHGNCSYEATIFNLNDRKCFAENLPMGASFYRRVWNTDMMNKILDKQNSWNPGLTQAQIRYGFEELMQSGVYERPFFGDMIMAGIACGMRKKILVFNTNENTTHDPISVIDPSDYGGSSNSEIPLVVAYDLVHYESLHPVQKIDIEKTVSLVNSYTARPSRYASEYGFTNNDMIYLISNDTQEFKEEEDSNKVKKLKESTDSSHQRNPGFEFDNILFEELENGQTRCGVCKTECLRLIVHLNRFNRCNTNFDMLRFKAEYSKYRSKLRKEKMKADDPEDFRARSKKSYQKHVAKKKSENIEGYKKDANKRQKARQTKRKEENLNDFIEKAKESFQKHVAKKKAENLEGFKKDANKRQKARQTKRKAENLENFKKKRQGRVTRSVNKD